MDDNGEHVLDWERGVNGLFTCNVCHKTFRRKDRLTTHFRTHTGERPYVCQEPGCGQSYCRLAHLQRHHRNVHQPKTGDRLYIQCEDEDCEKTFPVTRCTVDGCTTLFTTRQNLQKHIQRKHSVDGQQKYKCGVEGCGAAFAKHHLLRSHSYIHTNTDPYTCSHPQCGRTFKWPTLLRRHQKVHQGYTCDVNNCSITFDKWSDLRKHKAKEHSQDFQCEKCGKVFQRQQALVVHSQMHDGQRTVYQCPRDGCQRVYLNKRNLKTHLSCFHDGQRFACRHPGCDKTFASKQKSKEHERTHDAASQQPVKQGAKKRGHAGKRKKQKNLASRLTGHHECHPLPPDFEPLTPHPQPSYGIVSEDECAKKEEMHGSWARPEAEDASLAHIVQETWSSVGHVFSEQHLEQRPERDCVDAGMNRLLTERDSMDAGTDRLLTERDCVDAGTDRLLTERDCVDAGTDRLLTERDCVDAGTDRLLTERNSVNAGTDRLLTERDSMDAGTDRLLTERDSVDAGTDRLLTERESMDPCSDCLVTRDVSGHSVLSSTQSGALLITSM